MEIIEKAHVYLSTIDPQ